MEIDASLIVLYRLAQSLAPDRFPKAALGLLSELIPFDSAAWYARALHPSKIGDLWTVVPVDSDAGHAKLLRRTLERDLCAAVAVKHPGNVVKLGNCPRPRGSVGAASHSSGRIARIFTDSICMAIPDATSGWFSVASLWAMDSEAPFSEQDTNALRNLLPHMLEARTINRHLHLRSVEPDDLSLKHGTAWVSDEGLPLAMDGEFRRIVRSEWPEWDGGPLPAQLIDDSARRSARIVASFLRITSLRQYGMQRVELARVALQPKLSTREREVVSWYLQGKTYRQIAQQIGIAENTVRTHLGRIFQKLRVHNKVELLRKCAQEEVDRER